MKYLEFSFTVNPLEPARDILVAELGEIGFESFVETNEGVLGYILQKDWNADRLKEVLVLSNTHFNISYTIAEIEPQNWNEEWEKNFSPIQIADDCRIRAPFHEYLPVTYDIVIEPKMSFGTGHHETTSMMLQHILDNDFQAKTVLDMGSGTGVLAILSEMKGASAIEAIDIDPWCYENALENVERNNCSKISVYQGDAQLLRERKYDIILANINRNILLNDMGNYVQCLNQRGQLFLSGFYEVDLNEISSKCEEYGLKIEKKFEKNTWISAKYVF